LGAVTIWAAWMPITRLSVSSTLGPFDLAFLRFAAAGILLAPVLLRPGLDLGHARWWHLLILVLGAGAPYSLVAASGLQFAPAAHAGALTPGVMPVFAGLLAAFFLGERINVAKGGGYILILVGVLTIAGWASLAEAGEQWRGHCLFITAAFMWAAYTVTLRKTGLEPLHGAALVAVGSAIGIGPAYLCFGNGQIWSAPIEDILFQLTFQALIATVLSLILFGKAVRLLGASAAASYGALVPGLAAMMGIFILHEFPTMADLIGIACVSAGVFLATRAARCRLIKSAKRTRTGA
jgi:drug/metabolite transporter (DMT)-like permease